MADFYSVRRLAYAAVAIAAAGTIVHVIASAGEARAPEFIEGWVYCLVILLAAVAVLARSVAVREDRLGWALIGAGLLSWALGEFLWTFVVSEMKPQPYPSIADVFYLLLYPLEIAGVITLVKGRLEGRGAGVLLDGAIAAFGAAAIGAALLGPAISDLAAKDMLQTVVEGSYPIFDVMMIGCVIGALAVVGPRRDMLVLLVAISVVATADTMYLSHEAGGTYKAGTLLDSTWLIGTILMGIAAWQLPREKSQLLTRHGIVVPAAAVLTAIGLLYADHSEPLSDAAVILATATLLLALVRLVLVFRDNGALLAQARSDSITDSLTGLSNRRRLIDDLEGATRSAREEGQGFLLAIFDLDGFKSYNDTFGHGAGDMLLRRMGSSLRSAVAGQGTAYRLGGDEFCVLAPLTAGRVDSIVAAAGAALAEDGEGFSITASHGRALIPHEANEPVAALRLADRRLYAEKGRSTRSFESQARDLLLGVLREREPLLGAHLEGVGKLAAELARRVGLTPEEVDVVGRAAELHDIGKMAIPDEILSKPAPLTEEEWTLMRTHTLVGERMLSVLPALAPVGKLIRSSHERWDGDGYPDRFAGSKIPIGSRIIGICDAFEAMTEERPYRESLEVDDALEELRANAGTQFDPQLVELFCELVREGVPTPVPSS
jgi:diguanylate cyclase (GGDEF)-like protein